MSPSLRLWLCAERPRRQWAYLLPTIRAIRRGSPEDHYLEMRIELTRASCLSDKKREKPLRVLKIYLLRAQTLIIHLKRGSFLYVSGEGRDHWPDRTPADEKVNSCSNILKRFPFGDRVPTLLPQAGPRRAAARGPSRK